MTIYAGVTNGNWMMAHFFIHIPCRSCQEAPRGVCPTGRRSWGPRLETLRVWPPPLYTVQGSGNWKEDDQATWRITVFTHIILVKRQKKQKKTRAWKITKHYWTSYPCGPTHAFIKDICFGHKYITHSSICFINFLHNKILPKIKRFGEQETKHPTCERLENDISSGQRQESVAGLQNAARIKRLTHLRHIYTLHYRSSYAEQCYTKADEVIRMFETSAIKPIASLEIFSSKGVKT